MNAVASAPPDPRSRGAGPTGESDAVVVRRLAAGEPGARQALYERFAPVVRGIALAHLPSQDAGDLEQDVFVHVFGRIGQLRDAHALGGWVASVARNLARDRLRRLRRRPRAVPIDDAAVATRDRAGHELAERVMVLVRSLPEAYRETLLMRLVEGLSGPEIAERTGMTHGSVRVNLSRGMALLRPQLTAEGWGG